MKIINLGRGQGKTTRLLYASEFNYTPILCADYDQKKHLINMANRLGLKIPEPIVASEITSNKIKGNKVEYKDLLIDEANMVLQVLLNQLDMHGKVKAITLTSDELK